MTTWEQAYSNYVMHKTILQYQWAYMLKHPSYASCLVLAGARIQMECAEAEYMVLRRRAIA